MGVVPLKRHLLLVWPALLAACCYVPAAWALLQVHLAAATISGAEPVVADTAGVLTYPSLVAALTFFCLLARRRSLWWLPALAAILHIWEFSRLALGFVPTAVFLVESGLSVRELLHHPVGWAPQVALLLAPATIAPVAALLCVRLRLSVPLAPTTLRA
jgi:hypothetical protein